MTSGGWISSGPLYHGGVRGRKVGESIYPPSVTGYKHSQAQYGNNLVRADRVYVTSLLGGALAYAAGVRGWVYEVEPEGGMEPDPDATGVGYSWACRSARVVRVVMR